MYKKIFFVGLFIMLGVLAFGQDASTVDPRKGPADKMMLRSNTRDCVIVMRSNRHQRIERFKRQDNLYQNHRQLQRRMLYNRQQRIMHHHQRQNMHRHIIHRQRVQQSRNNRPR